MNVMTSNELWAIYHTTSIMEDLHAICLCAIIFSRMDMFFADVNRIYKTEKASFSKPFLLLLRTFYALTMLYLREF